KDLFGRRYWWYHKHQEKIVFILLKQLSAVTWKNLELDKFFLKDITS
ncbi:8096_t:CDS:1, partial [Cetraspora pellucida]